MSSNRVRIYPQPAKSIDERGVRFEDQRSGGQALATFWRFSHAQATKHNAFTPRLSLVLDAPPVTIMAPINATMLSGPGTYLNGQAAARCTELLIRVLAHLGETNGRVKAASSSEAAMHVHSNLYDRLRGMQPAIEEAVSQLKNIADGAP